MSGVVRLLPSGMLRLNDDNTYDFKAGPWYAGWQRIDLDQLHGREHIAFPYAPYAKCIDLYREWMNKP